MPDLARPNLPLPAPVTTLRGWLDDLAAHNRRRSSRREE